MDFIYVKGELNKNLKKKKQFGFDFNKVMHGQYIPPFYQSFI